MNEILITVVHPTARVKPSAAFPEGWRESARACFERAEHPELIQYITVVHESRWDHLFESEQAELGTFGAWEHHDLIKNSGRDCCVDQANAAIPVIAGKLIVVMQDDMFPPQGWDTLLLDLFRDSHGNPVDMDREAVIHVSSGKLTSDGWALPARNDTLYNPQIVTKSRVDRLGYLGYPGYISVFSDDEFSEHAWLDGCVMDACHILFEHRHPIFGGQVDEIYHNENSTEAYRVGLELLTRRRASKFRGDGAEPREIAPLAPREQGEDLPKLVVCLPGESFSSRWVAQWDGLRCFLSSLFQVQPIWAQSSNVFAVRNRLAAEALKAGADYVLWLDDDNVIEPGQFLMLYEDLRAHQDIGLVAAWCWRLGPHGFRPQKGILSFGHFATDRSCIPSDTAELTAGEGDLLARDWTGFPCVLMPRGTLELLGRNPFTGILSEASDYGMLGEDISFCIRTKQAGLKVVIDRRAKVPHLKMMDAEPVEPVEGLPERAGIVRKVKQKVLAMMGA